MTTWIQIRIIQVIHLAIVLFLILAPFVSNNVGWLLFHIFFMFAIIMHWVNNHHFCVLALAESRLRGIEYEEGFLNRILKPLFGFGVNLTWAYIIAIGLIIGSIVHIVLISTASRKKKADTPEEEENP